MSASLRQLNPIADSNWDAKLADFPNATFFHTSSWARVLQGTYGFTPRYLGDRETDNFRCLVPLMEVDSWITGRRGVGLPFTDSCPILIQPDFSADDLWHDIVAIATARAWKYIELRGGAAIPPDASAAVSYFNHCLDLGLGESKLWNQCHESVRRALRKAEQNHLSVEISQSLTGIRQFYQLLCQTRRRHGVPVQPLRFFENIQREVLAPGNGDIILARRGQDVVAGAIFFKHRGSVLYKFGASDRRFQQLRANNEVMWKAIRHYSSSGFAQLEFGRTSLYNEGLRRFKLGWGTTESILNYYRFNVRAGHFVSTTDSAQGWQNHFFRALPGPLLRLAGAVMYKHVA